MAYDKTKLATWPTSTLGRCGEYRTTDAKATIMAANYFNSSWEALPKGTILDIVAATDTTPVYFSVIVTASSSSAVTVVLQTVA